MVNLLPSPAPSSTSTPSSAPSTPGSSLPLALETDGLSDVDDALARVLRSDPFGGGVCAEGCGEDVHGRIVLVLGGNGDGIELVQSKKDINVSNHGELRGGWRIGLPFA